MIQHSKLCAYAVGHILNRIVALRRRIGLAEDGTATLELEGWTKEDVPDSPSEEFFGTDNVKVINVKAKK